MNIEELRKRLVIKEEGQSAEPTKKAGQTAAAEKAAVSANAKIEAQLREKVEVEIRAKIKAEQEAQAKADKEAKAKAEQEAKAKADEEAKVKADKGELAPDGSRWFYGGNSPYIVRALGGTTPEDYQFKKPKRDFYVKPEDEAYQKLKKVESKRVERARKKHTKQVNKLAKKGEEWFYDGI